MIPLATLLLELCIAESLSQHGNNNNEQLVFTASKVHLSQDTT